MKLPAPDPISVNAFGTIALFMFVASGIAATLSSTRAPTPDLDDAT